MVYTNAQSFTNTSVLQITPHIFHFSFPEFMHRGDRPSALLLPIHVHVDVYRGRVYLYQDESHLQIAETVNMHGNRLG